MKKEIRKPLNWDDFEDLCKQIWKLEYDCDDIQRNGRKGQNQNGVDISGFYTKINGYFGIQCKGKDAYNPDAQLTISEINEEIEKAKSFIPKLKKFIFATTANKNSRIEEYIRMKDVESRENGGFLISLFSWEDLTDLIEKHKYVFEWYVIGKLHSSSYSIKFSIDDNFGSEDKPYELKPKYLHKIINHETIRYDPFLKRKDNPYINQLDIMGSLQPSTFDIMYGTPIKNNCVKFILEITNIGNGSFNNCDFGLKIEEPLNINILYFKYNESFKRKLSYKTKSYNKEIPYLNTGIAFKEELYIEFDEKINSIQDLPSTFEINWFFSSNEHTKISEGTLFFRVNPLIERKEFTHYDMMPGKEYKVETIEAFENQENE